MFDYVFDAVDSSTSFHSTMTHPIESRYSMSLIDVFDWRASDDETASPLNNSQWDEEVVPRTAADEHLPTGLDLSSLMTFFELKQSSDKIRTALVRRSSIVTPLVDLLRCRTRWTLVWWSISGIKCALYWSSVKWLPMPSCTWNIHRNQASWSPLSFLNTSMITWSMPFRIDRETPPLLLTPLARRWISRRRSSLVSRRRRSTLNNQQSHRRVNSDRASVPIDWTLVCGLGSSREWGRTASMTLKSDRRRSSLNLRRVKGRRWISMDIWRSWKPVECILDRWRLSPRWFSRNSIIWRISPWFWTFSAPAPPWSGCLSSLRSTSGRCSPFPIHRDTSGIWSPSLPCWFFSFSKPFHSKRIAGLSACSNRYSSTFIPSLMSKAYIRHSLIGHLNLPANLLLLAALSFHRIVLHQLGLWDDFRPPTGDSLLYQTEFTPSDIKLFRNQILQGIYSMLKNEIEHDQHWQGSNSNAVPSEELADPAPAEKEIFSLRSCWKRAKELIQSIRQFYRFAIGNCQGSTDRSIFWLVVLSLSDCPESGLLLPDVFLWLLGDLSDHRRPSAFLSFRLRGR